MEKQRPSDKFDINYILFKSLYLGMGLNIVGPGALLFLCFYFDMNNKLSSPIIGFESANIFRIVLIVLSLLTFGLALYKNLQIPKTLMISSKETLEEDLRNNLYFRLRPVFIMIALVSLYGIIYYFITGRFDESAFFVIISFLVFQFVRPRMGSVKKLIESQLELLKTKNSA